MKLIALGDPLADKVRAAGEPIMIECSTGGEMSKTMHRVAAYCKKASHDESWIIWTSKHHRVFLWFEVESNKTMFALTVL